MTKMKTLLTKAKKEIKTEQDEKAVYLVKESLRQVKDAKKTLKYLEKQHKKLMETNVDEIEIEDFEY